MGFLKICALKVSEKLMPKHIIFLLFLPPGLLAQLV